MSRTRERTHEARPHGRRPAGDDVHVLLRRHPPRRRLAPGALGRPPARHQLPAPVGHHQLPRRRARGDRDAHHRAPRIRRQPHPRPPPRRVGLEGRRLAPDPRVRLGHGHGLHHAPHPGAARQRQGPLPRGRREPDHHPARPAEPADHDPGPLRRPDAPRAQGALRGAHQAAPRADRGRRLGRDHRRRRARDPGRSRSRQARPLRPDRRAGRGPRRRLQPQPPGRDDPQGDVQVRPARRRRVRVARRDRRDRPPRHRGGRRRPAARRGHRPRLDQGAAGHDPPRRRREHRAPRAEGVRGQHGQGDEAGPRDRSARSAPRIPASP